jgi:hypothetical protein
MVSLSFSPEGTQVGLACRAVSHIPDTEFKKTETRTHTHCSNALSDPQDAEEGCISQGSRD